MGGAQRSERSLQDFRHFVAGNSLCDLGFDGHFWTWRRAIEGKPTTYERLDRFLCSAGWRDLFPRASCKHIYTFASDHCFVIGDTSPLNAKGHKSFIFDQRWVSKEGIYEAVKEGWGVSHKGSRMYRFAMKIKSVRVSILKWKGSRTFNAAVRIKNLKNDLNKAVLSNVDSSVVTSLKNDLIAAYKEEESYWAQKSRVSWLKDGDKNTRFFHAAVSNRRKKNFISVLKKANSNDWCQSFDEISDEFSSFYSSLFTSSGSFEDLENYFGNMETKISHEMNQKLMMPISELEVKRAVFGMKSHSAPGPDGMTPIFYKKFYNVIKEDLISMVQGFFLSGKMLREMNHACISLIPKQPCPLEVSHFRPISLCNVSYRILSKILANRLKKVLPVCISSSQSAFISGRYISDNYILAHEIINMLVHGSKGRSAFMALKIDMAKAFDRVEWPFIRYVMAKLGFCKEWIDMILECVSSASFSFVINGVRTGFVKPSRGIRQGDPLSPYLFLICVEGLSLLLKNAEESGCIQGFKVARSSPSISHLFFADDSLVICKADQVQASNLQDLLNIYQKCSGQLINYQKSGIFFSKNIDLSLKQAILNSFVGISVVSHSKYLGLPLLIGRSKKETFNYLKNRVCSKLSSWKNNLLNQAGKEVLIKSVITMLVSYPMSVLKFPKGLCKELSSCIARFWWGNGSDGKKGIHWLSWKKLCMVKGMGGLGFRDFEALNMAYLARQIWRILMNPDLLVTKVLKSKYFPNCSLLDAKSSSTCSYFWRSILSVLPMFKEAVCWCVGNGESIKIWEDNWLPQFPNCRPFTPDVVAPHTFWVSDLIVDCSWNEKKIRDMFWPVDANNILSLPISKCHNPDSLFWRPSSNGKFSIKSAYSFFLNRLNRNEGFGRNNDVLSTSSSHGSDTKVWKFLWSLSLPNKVKHFFWKCLNNILPNNSNISHRLNTYGISPLCSFCGNANETVEHILFSCARASDVWRISSFSGFIPRLGVDVFAWWDDIVHGNLPNDLREKIEQILFFFWHIWKARNEWVFNKNYIDPGDVVSFALKDWQDFSDAMSHISVCDAVSGKSAIVFNTLDSLPSVGEKIDTAAYEYVVHTDAAWTDVSNPSGGGAVIFDRDYNLVEVWGRSFHGCDSALRAEAEVVRWAMLVAKERGWGRLLVRSDSLLLCQMACNMRDPDPEVMTLIKDIRSLMDNSQNSVFHFSRKVNVISHNVAKFARKLVRPMFWSRPLPAWVVSLDREEKAAMCLS